MIAASKKRTARIEVIPVRAAKVKKEIVNQGVRY